MGDSNNDAKNAPPRRTGLYCHPYPRMRTRGLLHVHPKPPSVPRNESSVFMLGPSSSTAIGLFVSATPMHGYRLPEQLSAQHLFDEYLPPDTRRWLRHDHRMWWRPGHHHLLV